MYSARMKPNTYDLVLQEYHAGRFQSLTFCPIPKGMDFMLNGEHVKEPYETDLPYLIEEWFQDLPLIWAIQFEPGLEGDQLYFKVRSQKNLLDFGPYGELFYSEILRESLAKALEASFGVINPDEVMVSFEARMEDGKLPDDYYYLVQVCHEDGEIVDVSDVPNLRVLVIDHLMKFLKEAELEEYSPHYTIDVLIAESILFTFQLEHIDRVNVMP